MVLLIADTIYVECLHGIGFSRFILHLWPPTSLLSVVRCGLQHHLRARAHLYGHCTSYSQSLPQHQANCFHLHFAASCRILATSGCSRPLSKLTLMAAPRIKHTRLSRSYPSWTCPTSSGSSMIVWRIWNPPRNENATSLALFSYLQREGNRTGCWESRRLQLKPELLEFMSTFASRELRVVFFALCGACHALANDNEVAVK